jgi:hypothetical protein
MNITTNPQRDRFNSSQVTDYLIENEFSKHDRRKLSAPVSNILTELEEGYDKIIIRDPKTVKKRYIPRIIMDRDRLRELCDPEAIPVDVDRIEAPSDNEFLLESIHKLEQRLATLEANVSNTQHGVEDTKCTMELIINDRSKFEKHFCPEHVLERLDDIPVWAYHEIVQGLFKIIGFKAANAQKNFTTYPNEMPLLTFGLLAKDGSIRQPRFGITCHTQVTGPRLAPVLYIWISKKAYKILGGASFFQNCHTRVWRGEHVILPELPLAIQQHNGWFLRNFTEDDKATKILRELAKFSKTDPRIVKNLGIKGPATPEEIRAAASPHADNE